MFSIIVTVISIALAAVLALATIFYGGEIFTSQKEKATVATLNNQMQQIYAASQAYYLDHQEWPANTAILAVNGLYLKTAPVPPGAAYAALQPGYAPGLVPSALATGNEVGEDGSGGGGTPVGGALAGYLGTEGVASLKADFNLTDADAPVLQAQLVKLQEKDAALPELVLRVMAREKALQAAHKPSVLDYTWPAAAAQNPRTRYMWVPDKVSKETCRAVNQMHRGSMLIPDTYNASYGAIQCFGTDTAGYSYLWLSPGADPAQVAGSLPGVSGGSSEPSGECGATEIKVGNTCVARAANPDASNGRHMPGSLTLGAVQVGGTKSAVVTVTNRSGAPQTYALATYDYSSTSTPAFSITDDVCSGNTVAPAATCTFKVSWNPVEVADGDLSINLSGTDMVPEWCDVMASATAGSPPTFDLVFNQGQVGGSSIFPDGSADFSGNIWGNLPEAQLAHGSNTMATFCAAGAAAAAALQSLEPLGWWWQAENLGTDGWMTVVQRTDGQWCLELFQSSVSIGAYPLNVPTSVGVFSSVMVVRAAPVPTITSVTPATTGPWTDNLGVAQQVGATDRSTAVKGTDFGALGVNVGAVLTSTLNGVTDEQNLTVTSFSAASGAVVLLSQNLGSPANPASFSIRLVNLDNGVETPSFPLAVDFACSGTKVFLAGSGTCGCPAGEVTTMSGNCHPPVAPGESMLNGAGAVAIGAAQGPAPVWGYYWASFDLSLVGEASRIKASYYTGAEIPGFRVNGMDLIQTAKSGDWVAFSTPDYAISIVMYWADWGWGLGRPMSGNQFYIDMQGSDIASFENLTMEWLLDGERAAYVALQTTPDACDLTQFGFSAPGASVAYQIMDAKAVELESNPRCISFP